MEWLKKTHDFLIDREKVKLELYWIKKHGIFYYLHYPLYMYVVILTH